MYNSYGEPTKNIMTKKQCGERLFKEYMAAIPMLAVVSGLMTVIWLIAMASDDLILIILSSVVELLTVVGVVVFIIDAIRVKNGNFRIKKDRLMRIAIESERNFTSNVWRRYREVTVFYFFGGGRYKISIADGSIKEYSNIDDDFYLVCVGKRREKIMAIYNCRLYEIK